MDGSTHAENVEDKLIVILYCVGDTETVTGLHLEKF